MGLRFRRSIKVMPGVRMYFSGSGVSTSIGPRGASINIGPRGTSANVGIPGTGLSYRSKLASPQKAYSAAQSTQAFSNLVGDASDGGPTFTCAPEETVYRISALLAAALTAGASANEVELRIAGLLPERIGRATCVQLAKALLTIALGHDGTSYKGTAAVRRALTKCGLRDTGLVTDAVSAVRASLKARRGEQVESSLPVEWYRIGDLLLSREYEAPSLRARVPELSLLEFHRMQIELGAKRLAVIDLLDPPGRYHFLWLLFAAAPIGLLVLAAIAR